MNADQRRRGPRSGSSSRCVVAPRHLKRTVSVALVVGTAFFTMNQLGVILDGRATALVWLKAALTYLTPLLVSNFGLLSDPTHRRPPPAAGDRREHATHRTGTEGQQWTRRR